MLSETFNGRFVLEKRTHADSARNIRKIFKEDESQPGRPDGGWLKPHRS